MRVYYLDESEGPNYFVRSAIGINAEVWSDAFTRICDWRKRIKSQYKIPLSQELHATDLLGGRGHIIKIGKKYHGFKKELGVEIFISGLKLLERIASALSGGVEIINVSLRKKDYPKADEDSLERVLNRINKSISVEPRYAFLVFDEGKEGMITRRYRKALAYNPIPSKYGHWNGGKEWKHIPPKYIVGAPAFRSSKSDYFLQFADFVAHALLKKDEPAIPRVTQYHLDKAFDFLDKALNKKASEKEEQGVVRH